MNICFMGVSEGEKEGTESLSEKKKKNTIQKTMAANVPNYRKEKDIQVQEAQKTPTRMK